MRTDETVAIVYMRINLHWNLYNRLWFSHYRKLHTDRHSLSFVCEIISVQTLAISDNQNDTRQITRLETSFSFQLIYGEFHLDENKPVHLITTNVLFWWQLLTWVNDLEVDGEFSELWLVWMKLIEQFINWHMNI